MNIENHSRSKQLRRMKADFNKLNKLSTSIGPKLAKQVPKLYYDIDIPCFEYTMFLSDTNPNEVARIK